MPGLEKVSFEGLPQIGETPLKGGDLLTIMRWAVDRRNYARGLEERARKAGAFWEEEPERLIGDIDKPTPNTFMPGYIYSAAAEFGLKVAQTAAYNRSHQDKVSGLNRGLRGHFQAHNTRVAMLTIGSDNLVDTSGAGIFRLPDARGAWGEPVQSAVGAVTGIDVGSATIWLEALNGQSYGARLLPIESAVARTDYVNVTLSYPAVEAAARLS